MAKKNRAKMQRWTERETQLFYEGLEMFGKNWPRIALHVGTKSAYKVTAYGAS